MFCTSTSDQQYTSWKVWVISNDDNSSSKESKCFQWRWHCQQIRSKFTSLSTARQIYHWPAHNSAYFEFAYSPYSSHPRISHCPKNAMFCFHWWLTIHQWTEFQYPIPLMSKFPMLSISPFSAESGQTSNRKVPCFTNKVLEWYPHVFQIHNFLDDKIRTTVQLITYTAPQNSLSMFTIHNFLMSQLTSAVELSDFLVRVVTWVRSDWVPM